MATNIFQVIDNTPDGANIGKTASDKVSFHGITPSIQQTAPSALTGASDSTAVATAVNLIRTALINKGIVA